MAGSPASPDSQRGATAGCPFASPGGLRAPAQTLPRMCASDPTARTRRARNVNGCWHPLRGMSPAVPGRLPGTPPAALAPPEVPKNPDGRPVLPAWPCAHANAHHAHRPHLLTQLTSACMAAHLFQIAQYTSLTTFYAFLWVSKPLGEIFRVRTKSGQSI